MKAQTVAAMRDAAGLRWGGADLGGDNGDLMHFDGHDMQKAGQIHWAKMQVVAAKTAETSKPKNEKK